MLRRVFALAALAVLPSFAHAQLKEAACVELPGVGCYFVPAAAGPDAPLVVYLRGHHPVYGPNVPASQSLASSRQAFMAYGLGLTAMQQGTVLLVTYRSGIGVTDADMSALSKATGRVFMKLILAAHSGGYVGLGKTLDTGISASQIVMLDDFYGAGSDGLPLKIQRLVSAGAKCTGYYTPHNQSNYNTGFKNAVACPVDALSSNTLHGPGVTRCLGAYLSGRSCL